MNVAAADAEQMIRNGNTTTMCGFPAIHTLITNTMCAQRTEIWCSGTLDVAITIVIAHSPFIAPLMDATSISLPPILPCLSNTS